MAIKMQEAYEIMASYMNCSIEELYDKYKVNKYWVDMTYLGIFKPAYDCLVLIRDDFSAVVVDIETGKIYDENSKDVNVKRFYLEDEFKEIHPEIYKKKLSWDQRNKEKKNRIINKSKAKNYIKTSSKEEMEEIEKWIKERKNEL